jgi:N-acetylmuramoyl-L-alanine amidase
MDELILKWVTALTGGLTVVVCITFLLLPKLHENAVLAAENYQEEAYAAEKEETAVEAAAVQPVVVSAPEEIVEADENMEARLKIELPEGVTQKDVTIDNNYLTQTVYIHIPCQSRDYFSEYCVKGSCEHISTISYYSDSSSQEGIIALSLNRVYELDEMYEDGSLYLEFIDPHDIYDKVIVVDAGHGGRASGATKNDIEEKNINLGIVTELKALLDASTENIGVYYTRLDDANPTLDQRVQLANRADADLFISVHSNATSTNNFSGRHGTEVLYSESDSSELSSKKFAQICQQNVTEALGSKDLGLVAGDQIYIIRTSEVPVALIEVGYMTNREELRNLASGEYQALAAQGIYNAILEAFEAGY